MNWRGRTFAVFTALVIAVILSAIGLFADSDLLSGTEESIIVVSALLLAALGTGYLYDKAAALSRRAARLLSLNDDQHKKESELEHCISQLKRMLEHLPDPVFLYIGERGAYCNGTATALLGTDQAAAASYPALLDRLHQDDRETLEWLPPFERGKSFRREMRFRRQDGQYMDSEWLFSCTDLDGRTALQIVIRDISGQKELERKLKTAEEESLEILRHQQGITFKLIKAADRFVFTLWAGELAYDVGLPPGEVIGKSPEQVLSPDAAGELLHYCGLVREERKGMVFEIQMMETPCLFSVRPFVQNGGAEEMVGYISDISQRKETEAELLRTREMLESFFSNTSDAIDVTDLDGRIMHTNQAFVDMFGWPYEQCVGSSVLMIVPSELHEELQNFHEVVEYGGHISGYETKRVRNSGELFDVSVTISPIRNSTGSTIAIAAISRDITDSKLVEAALRKSETKYRLIAENMTDVVGVLNYRGLIEYMSPSSHSMLGLTPEELIGKSVFQWLHPEDLSQIGQFFKKSLTVGPGDVAELRIKHSDGRWVDLEVFSRWMPDLDQGSLPNILMVARDITERKKAEEMLLKSEKLSVVGQLAAGVAHEIRNPLTSLKGFLQLLQRRTSENGFFFELMLSELDRINNIVSEFLVLSKPQTAKKERRNLVQIVQVVISFLSSQALLNNVQIAASIETGPEVMLDCDENQLKQVFINLLKNAVEAMPDGGVITVTVQQAGPEKVLVRFEDQGQGIPKERIQKLGEPFYTTKEKGTGLGLMVSFRIIEEHGGHIRVTSELGVGTVFDVELPLQSAMLANA